MAAGVATAALASCGADTDNRAASQARLAPSYVASEPESWDKEADMVILGCGITSACAASA